MPIHFLIIRITNLLPFFTCNEITYIMKIYRMRELIEAGRDTITMSIKKLISSDGQPTITTF